MTISDWIQLSISVALVPMGLAIIALLISQAKMRTIIVGNGTRGLAGDVASNRKHIDALEKNCASQHSDNNHNHAPAIEAAVERIAKAAEIRFGTANRTE